MSTDNLTVEDLIQRLWIAPEHAEWTPKTNELRLSDIREWLKSHDIEVLGFVMGIIHDGRFRIEPPPDPAEYVDWVKLYYGRCFQEDPDDDWSDSAYLGGASVVRIYVKLWDDNRVDRKLLLDLKNWLAHLYREGDERLRTCIIHATLEHVFERKPIRKFFSDWKQDPVLISAYEQACLWDIKTPLSD